jgi:hypothetical protein
MPNRAATTDFGAPQFKQEQTSRWAESLSFIALIEYNHAMNNDQMRIMAQHLQREQRIRLPFVFHLAAWLIVAFVLLYGADSLLRYLSAQSQVDQQRAVVGTP